MISFIPTSLARILQCCCLLMFLTGCASHDEGAHDDHEDEHLTHFVPAHKPASFGELVDQLATRIPELGESWPAKDATQTQTRRQELSDVIGWIPELAADSELRKADFETAVSAGKTLQAEFDKQFATGNMAQPNLQPFETALESLRGLKENSKERNAAM